MRKFLTFLMIVCLSVIFTAGIALADQVKAKGTLKSIDSKTGVVVFCPKGTKDEIPIKVDKERLSLFKKGDKVKITYDKTDKGNTASKLMKDRGLRIPAGC